MSPLPAHFWNAFEPWSPFSWQGVKVWLRKQFKVSDTFASTAWACFSIAMVAMGCVDTGVYLCFPETYSKYQLSMIAWNSFAFTTILLRSMRELAQSKPTEGMILKAKTQAWASVIKEIENAPAPHNPIITQIILNPIPESFMQVEL